MERNELIAVFVAAAVFSGLNVGCNNSNNDNSTYNSSKELYRDSTRKHHAQSDNPAGEYYTDCPDSTGLIKGPCCEFPDGTIAPCYQDKDGKFYKMPSKQNILSK